MTIQYSLSELIELHVKGRISPEDAARQSTTAGEILRRLSSHPGVILADEVGMGKTFVALAVAASVALSDAKGRPVVVMVPPSLREKWPADFSLFREKCLPPEISAKLQYGRAERAVEFLKLLDDPPERKKSILFVTHGAMSRGLADGWVKLALIRRAMLWRRNPGLRSALNRFMSELLRMQWVDRYNPDIWQELLSTPARNWLEVLQFHGIDPENDDPVPEAVIEVFDKLNLDSLYETLDIEMPRKRRQHFTWHLNRARQAINKELRSVWKDCLKHLKLRLPLLILDEAHHLKNSQTRLASLFHAPEAQQDAEEINRGALGGVFERMLFLTATPFQLGHHELCSVLERFDGIRWSGRTQPPMGRAGFAEQVNDLRRSLDRAQESALHLDQCWGRLRQDDLVTNGTVTADVDTWWREIRSDPPETTTVRQVLNAYSRAHDRLKHAEKLLQPWVIRHLKARMLPGEFADVPRRERLPGSAIIEGSGEEAGGISVDGESLLPFLLAARATACMPQSRPVFAEGLASSYEAFLHTRRNNLRKKRDNFATDTDDDETLFARVPAEARWYLEQLQRFLPLIRADIDTAHPKLSATVNRVVDIWRTGEKVLVFCHYVATGRVLRQRISQAIAREINSMAAARIGCSPEDGAEQLEKLGERFFDADSPLRRGCDTEVQSLLANFPDLEPHAKDLVEIVRRNLRTPSFLVRYFPIERDSLGREAAAEALAQSDASGLSLRKLLLSFFEFLTQRCGTEDRRRYIEEMKAVQTGTHRGADTASAYAADELRGEQSHTLLPNVRLVNGDTAQLTRQRLMLTFNTPFYPEVLVASAVMAEGVDLHLCCRHIIHHDLCWNPSTLEQRTGRIDRIGAKVEQCGRPINIYLPYVAETQDEKMYRVVMDREQWFSIVMGEKIQLDARTTDKLAERVPVPRAIADELRFRLEVVQRSVVGSAGAKLQSPEAESISAS